VTTRSRSKTTRLTTTRCFAASQRRHVIVSGFDLPGMRESSVRSAERGVNRAVLRRRFYGQATVLAFCVEREQTLMEFVAEAMREKLRRGGIRTP
jgi:hypothetical protein